MAYGGTGTGRLTTATVSVLVALVVAACGGVRAGVDDPQRWWGRTFTSTAVEGDAPPGGGLQPGTEIDLTFDEQEGRRELRWNAGCNTWGAPVTIEADRLVAGPFSQSANGCRDELDRQDQWLHDFFAAEPRWAVQDGQLVLSADGLVMEFAETTDRGTAPASAFTTTWYDAQGRPAERGQDRNRKFEVQAFVGPRHCDWESVVFLSIVWPLGTTYHTGPDAPPIYEYVRDPDGKLGDLHPDQALDLDAVMPQEAVFTGYHTDQSELWFGPDEGERFVYLDTDHGVERWPRAVEPPGCA